MSKATAMHQDWPEHVIILMRLNVHWCFKDTNSTVYVTRLNSVRIFILMKSLLVNVIFSVAYTWMLNNGESTQATP